MLKITDSVYGVSVRQWFHQHTDYGGAKHGGFWKPKEDWGKQFNKQIYEGRP